MEATAKSSMTGQESEAASRVSSQQFCLWRQLVACHRYLEKTRIDTVGDRVAYTRERSRLKQAMDAMLQPLRDLADDKKLVLDCLRDVRLRSHTVHENIKAVASAEERINEMENKLTKEEHKMSKLQGKLFSPVGEEASQGFRGLVFNVPDNLVSDIGILDTGSEMTASVGRKPSMSPEYRNQKKRPREDDDLSVEELENEIYELNGRGEELRGLIRIKDNGDEDGHADLEDELADLEQILKLKKAGLIEFRAQKQARVASWVQQQEESLRAPTSLIDIQELVGISSPSDEDIAATVSSASNARRPFQDDEEDHEDGSPSKEREDVSSETQQGMNSVSPANHAGNGTTQQLSAGTKHQKHMERKTKR